MANAILSTQSGAKKPVNKRFRDLEGGEFNALMVVRYHGPRRLPCGAVEHFWECGCVCGKSVVVRGTKLTSGEQKSCGCLKRKRAMDQLSTHGMSRSPEYRAWTNMKTRCTNPKAINYHLYGGRGVSVYGEWASSFEEFYAYLGPRPTPLHSIDRFPNPSGNYEPGNVRWATPKQQARNRRRKVLIEVDGVLKTAVEWAEVSGVPADDIRSRLKTGWTAKRAVFEPKRTMEERNATLRRPISAKRRKSIPSENEGEAEPVSDSRAGRS